LATGQGGSMIIVKERPIPFSRPMVRAVLDDRKTTTRRALSVRALKNISIGAQIGECHELPTEGPLHPNSVGYYNDFCPYGKPGDRLWAARTGGKLETGWLPTLRMMLAPGAVAGGLSTQLTVSLRMNPTITTRAVCAMARTRQLSQTRSGATDPASTCIAGLAGSCWRSRRTH